MNRLSKAILIACGGVVGIGALLLLGANLYLQSPGVQSRLEAELSKALRLPLTITSSSLTPWSDLQIHGITVQGGDSPFLQAEHFVAHHRWLPLFRKQLIIDEMWMENPRILFIQSPNGKWGRPASWDPEPAGDVSLPPAAPAGGSGEPKSAPKKPKASSKERFLVVVKRVRIINGSVEIRNRKHEQLALATGLHIDSAEVGPMSFKGSVSIDSLVYQDALKVENLRAGFQYAAEQLTVPDLAADVAGGALNGSFSLDPRTEDFVLGLELAGVDMARVSKDAKWSGEASGTLTGSLKLTGNAKTPDDTVGGGHFSLAQGELRQLDFFKSIGELFQLDEFINLKLKNALVDLRVGEGKVWVEQALLEALNLRLSATGSCRWDGKLSLNANLAFEPKLAKKLPDVIRDSLTETDSSGLAGIGFKISGKLGHLKTDLPEKILGKKLGDEFESLVSGLLGKKKKPDKKKPKPAPPDSAGDSLKEPADNPVPPVPSVPSVPPQNPQNPVPPEPPRKVLLDSSAATVIPVQ